MKYKLLTFFLIASSIAFGVSHAQSASDSVYEERLINTLEQIQSSQLDSALQNVQSILADYPTSRLGYMLYGDLLMARANPVAAIGEPLSAATQQGVQSFREEIGLRWRHNREVVPAHSSQFPGSIVRAAPSHEYMVYVDLTQSRLYVYRNTGNVPELIQDYYVTMGLNGTRKLKQGDQRTPIGVYYVTNYIPGEDLPDRYGPGAFPINYPNEFDKRLARTGYGIWLHGVPSDTYSRAPKASDGCVALANEDFNTLYDYIEPDGLTPVIISDEVDWISVDELLERRRLYSTIVETWRRDWQSLDSEAYLQHYSKARFKSGGRDYNGWAKYKKEVNEGKSFVEVNLRDLSIFEYPGEKDMFVVNFDQEYRSNNYYGVARKQQYWSKDQNTGKWEIIFEGRG